MDQASYTVLRRSLVLWIGAATVISLLTAVAVLQDPAFTYAVLALTGAFALFGIGFGIWAANLLTRNQSRP